MYSVPASLPAYAGVVPDAASCRNVLADHGRHPSGPPACPGCRRPPLLPDQVGLRCLPPPQLLLAQVGLRCLLPPLLLPPQLGLPAGQELALQPGVSVPSSEPLHVSGRE